MSDHELNFATTSIEQLLDLLDRKIANPTNDDIQEQFFNDVLGYLLTTSSEHWWCDDRERLITQESLWLFSLPDHPSISHYKEKLSNQLRNCRKCLVYYYGAKPVLRKRYERLFSTENVESFFSLLARFDRHRVMKTLRRSLYIEDPSQPFTLSESLICTIYDILYTPSLLHEEDCDRLVCNLFDKMNANAVAPTYGCEVAEGISYLAFHHHEWIRVWARKQLFKFLSDGNDVTLSQNCMRSTSSLLSTATATDDSFPIKVVDDVGERWKSFRVLINLISATNVMWMLQESKIFGIAWLNQQLQSMNITATLELIKTLTPLFRKMDGDTTIWWDENDHSVPAESHYALIKQIFNSSAFKSYIMIAQQDKANKVVQKDGTYLSQDKLIGKIKSRLEWIYLYWKSIPSADTRHDLSNYILDTLLGYFQLDTWSILCKTICAEWSCDILDLYTGSDLSDKVNKHGSAIIRLASITTNELPESCHQVLERASLILKQVLHMDGKIMREIIFGITSTPKFESESLWQSLSEIYMQKQKIDQRLAVIVLSAYSEFAIADMTPNEANATSSPALQQISHARTVIQRILHNTSSTMIVENRTRMIERLDLVESFLYMLSSAHNGLREEAFKFLGSSNRDDDAHVFRKMFFQQPQHVLEKFNQLLDTFNNLALPLAIGEAFNMVPNLTRLLSMLLSAMVGDEDGYMIQTIVGGVTFSSVEHENVKGFWDTCWRTISLIFGSGNKWSELHKPRQVVSAIMPVFDIAHVMIGARQLFQKVMDSAAPSDMDFTSNDTQLQFDCVSTTVDSLSHWVYVTRSEVLEKLVPLLTSTMKHLHQAHVTISTECFQRLMDASTGVNATRLSTEQKESLFFALSTHEPSNNGIFLDDSSDDEDVEWEMVDATATIAPSNKTTTPDRNVTAMRQLKLGESFFKATDQPNVASTTPRRSKITSYFQSDSTASSSSIHDSSPMDISPVPDKSNASSIITSPKDHIQDVSQSYDDDFPMDDFGDMDFADLPDEWFEGRITGSELESEQEQSPVPPQSTKRSKSIAGAVQQHNRELQQQQQRQSEKDRRVPSVNRESHAPRFSVQPTKPTAYAVTSTGRKLKPPPMGFSKLRALRDEFHAEQKLVAAAKSPSASISNRKRRDTTNGSNSSSSSEGESSSDEDSGLQDLVKDIDKTSKNNKNPPDNKNRAEEERASMKALFEKPMRRSAQLIDTPATKYFLEKKKKIQEADRRRQKIRPDIDPFYKTVLSWDITKRTEIPPDTPKDTYQTIKDRYESFEEYLKVFQSLLLLETWMQVMRAKDALQDYNIIDRCVLDSRCHVNDFVDVTMNLAVPSANTLALDDLVCVANHFGGDFFNQELDFIRTDDKPSNWHGHLFLGKITTIVAKMNFSHVTMRCYFPAHRIKTLNALSPKSTWRMLKLTSMTTFQREYAGLQGLQHFDLAEEILHPKPITKAPINHRLKDECIARYGVNEPQAEAIAGALERKKGFTLIQGPPGTGKTKTILGLLVSLFDQARQQSGKLDGGKILVCAPSNAAVDEIAKRLKDGIMTSKGVVKPKVVRIGTSESVNASVKDILLDRLIEKEFAGSINGTTEKSQFASKRENLNEEIRKTQLEIEDADRAIAECTSSDISELREKRRVLVAKRSKLRTMIKYLSQDQRDYTRELELSRIRARQKVFGSVDVVCATLSGSGHDMLTSMGLSFGTVIVDEAAQSVEVSSLIPLKYDCQRCILVGDPNQLPPTVISQMANKFRYDQSLFMRLQKSAPDNVYLLSIQYRMHPAISSFPSKLFYNSLLRDAPDMDIVTCAPWHSRQYFPPYQFYNVEDGQERTGAGRSLYNPAEAEAAVALVDMLATQMPQLKLAYKIGVITPYKQQLSQLKSRFERRYGSRILDVIDFNTVDGFQGQEKDIIIFSCVRALSERGIGFLADIRRMNVGLTRARCSLFVLGHKRSLMGSQYWGDLVNDAMDRNLLINIRPPYFQHRLVPGNKPGNLFEQEKKIAGTKRSIPQPSITTKRIAIPQVNTESKDKHKISGDRSTRLVSSDREREEQSQIRTTPTAFSQSTPERSPSPATSLGRQPFEQQIPKRSSPVSVSANYQSSVKQPMDIDSPIDTRVQTPHNSRPAGHSGHPRPPNQMRRKMTLLEYRASKGLSPYPHQQRRSTPNLFIQRSRPSKAQAVTPSSDRLHAREQANLEHQAAKDAMKEVRRLERAQQHQQHSSESNNNVGLKSIDDMLHDIKRQN
ncbi:hypothetical protein K492DRAFT_143014 [Lichtheimia hyalospora FSU 10163]|nr:hypothetical protein K492DRAFT_143014 [Lichtheimia hyalospora FSU 10163]